MIAHHTTSVAALARDQVSYAAARVLDVARAPWDQVHVAVKDGLAGGFADIDADVEAHNERVVSL